MANVLQPLIPILQPLDYIPYDPTPLKDPEDVHQLKLDTINVLENRVDISTFPLDYQEKIKNFYRYSATAYTTKNSVCAKRTTDTLDII